MTETQPFPFQDYVKGSLHGLRAQTAAHRESWAFGTEVDWSLDQADGRLVLTFPDGTVAESPAQIIGMFDAAAGTWTWAWGVASVEPALREDALKVREFGREHGIKRHMPASWP